MHFLSICDFSPETLDCIIRLGVDVANGNELFSKRLDGKVVGLFFRGPSTRTRTSFAVAALRLGASIIQFGPSDLQMTTGESPKDTGMALSQYLDALVMRTNGSDAEMQEIAEQDQMTVVNAMSALEHPSQAIADLITIKEVTGGLADRHVVYMGEGNNTAASLALAVSLIPRMRLTLMTPEPYRLNPKILSTAERQALEQGSAITQHHSMDKLPRSADVVYTTRWETMGVSHEDPNWRDAFRPFKVTKAIFESMDNGRTVFMHDLPSVRDQDCDTAVLDGTRSVAFRQAKHKLHAAMAILATCINPTI